ncbi:DDE superfamily endonuclease [Popillia japonica]|uniref:DDE superfamily endonuclease n=1 Tax=Popillia japonica TaxID=7064 RepID=A0AAW1M1H1_POPJA
MEKINYNPSRLYNIYIVITLKGKKQVGTVTAAERGALVTVVFCMNAVGGFVPPLFVFPRKNMKADLLDGAPPGTIAACHPSGWIQQHIFSQWLQHFIGHIKPSLQDQVLLILDGHYYSHTRNIEVIEMGRKNHVTILCIPPPTSHRMQSLDIAFMSPFKTYDSQQIEMWLKQNPGRIANAFHICKLTCPAYLKSATAEISANGFRKCGIYPLNGNVFADHEFKKCNC